MEKKLSRKKYVTTDMRILTVVGISNSGKTTVVEGLIKELSNRGYSVGTVKSISCGSRCHLFQNGICHCSRGASGDHKFTIDSDVTNSRRHKLAGSQQVTTWAENETAVLFSKELTYRELVSLYDFDYLILEGDYYSSVPRIVTAKAKEDAVARIDDLTFVVSGQIANNQNSINGLPIINALEDMKTLADMVENSVFPQIPFADDLGCDLCGMSCRELSSKILKGEATIEQCLRKRPSINLTLDGKTISLDIEESQQLEKAVQRALRSAGIAPANSKIEISAENA